MDNFDAIFWAALSVMSSFFGLVLALMNLICLEQVKMLEERVDELESYLFDDDEDEDEENQFLEPSFS